MPAKIQHDLFLRAFFLSFFFFFCSLPWVHKYFLAEGYHNMTSRKAKQSIPSPSTQDRNHLSVQPVCFHLLPLIHSFILTSLLLPFFISVAVFPFVHPSLFLSSWSTQPLIRGK